MPARLGRERQRDFRKRSVRSPQFFQDGEMVGAPMTTNSPAAPAALRAS
jgi:hypothetical protein